MKWANLLITTSKVYEVVSKMTEIEKAGGGAVKICPWTRQFQDWFSLNQIFLPYNMEEGGNIQTSN